jgi:hypothetical protein
MKRQQRQEVTQPRPLVYPVREEVVMHKRMG